MTSNSLVMGKIVENYLDEETTLVDNNDGVYSDVEIVEKLIEIGDHVFGILPRFITEKLEWERYFDKDFVADEFIDSFMEILNFGCAEGFCVSWHEHYSGVIVVMEIDNDK